MSLAVINSCALAGMSAPRVCVEVHLSPGLPAMSIVGLPDAGVRESRDRVRSAIDNSAFHFPVGRFTVNLSPTDLPKESGRFDLPIAIGVLLASRQLSIPEMRLESFSHTYLVGELSLTGALISIQAPLIIALSIFKHDPQASLILPFEDAKIAARIQGLRVYGAESLNQVFNHLNGDEVLPIMVYDEAEGLPKNSQNDLCLSDIRGQAYACHILEIVASGAHGLILSGPPGVGKSMLAHRLPGLLPSLSAQEQLDVIAINSLAKVENTTITQAPFRAPHHSASMVALVGGGANAKPGEISLANHGVLFLDEFPEFDRRALEALREPLEKGEINIARAKRSQVYPARFQLIAAYNPCPCGYLGHPQKVCICTPDKISRYQSKLSGPILDRIDVHLTLQAVGHDWRQQPAAETSSAVRERVVRCRQLQLQRQGVLNAYLSEAQIREYCVMGEQSELLLQTAMDKFAWSARVSNKVLKVSRTVADMNLHQEIQAEDLSKAIMCRSESGISRF